MRRHVLMLVLGLTIFFSRGSDARPPRQDSRGDITRSSYAWNRAAPRSAAVTVRGDIAEVADHRHVIHVPRTRSAGMSSLRPAMSATGRGARSAKRRAE